jgi:dihydroorotate dehydrogenase
MLYPLVRPLLFRLDAERAHRLTIKALSAVPGGAEVKADPVLATRLSGIDFPNPVGLAPGYDKNAEVPHAMFRLGFGFVEVGTVTPRPQAGNPVPRLFRLVEDRAVINRMGFNNDGVDQVAGRIVRLSPFAGPVGINIGANKDSDDRIADYALMTQRMAPLADYLTVNISSPNTPGLRALQDKGALSALLDAVMEARGTSTCPIFLKLAPDLTGGDVDDIAQIALDQKLDALIISNTTVERPDTLRSRHAKEAGGLSGAPLRDMALQRLRDFRAATGGNIPLVTAGGIASAEHAYARILAGASLVQIYSAMVYEGPTLARRICHGLRAKLRADGFASITDAVGAGG